jgi:hypothetical protein
VHPDDIRAVGVCPRSDLQNTAAPLQKGAGATMRSGRDRFSSDAGFFV